MEDMTVGLFWTGGNLDTGELEFKFLDIHEEDEQPTKTDE